MTERYIQGPGTDQPIEWLHGSGSSDRRFFYTDYQDSLIASTNASGTLQELYKYGAYGELKLQPQ